MSDVVLSAALRTNLLSLQSTQKLIDVTQQRLATGLKVNSALDNAQNFFAAQSLNNRAGDLTRLLDGISQSIRTIEEADKGISALTNLIEQADSIATQALDQLNSVNSNAVAASTSSELSGLGSGLIVGGVTGAQATDAFSIQAGDEAALTVTLDANTTMRSLVAEINDRSAINGNEVQASIDADGNLQVRSTNGEMLRLTDTTGNFLRDIGMIRGATATTETFMVGSSLRIDMSGAGAITEFSTLNSTNAFEFDDATDVLTFTVDGGADVDFAAANTMAANIGAATIAELVNFVNSSVTGLDARFDAETSELVLTASSDASGITIGQSAAGGGTANTISINGQSAVAAPIQFNSSTGAIDETLNKLAGDYNEVRKQIDAIVKDASYRGVNLLQGDDLLTNFNEDRTSSLTTKGVDFTAAGMGISVADFSGTSAIRESLDQARAALLQVRNFGSSIANSLSIIQTRQDFTQGTINTLKAGALDLTKADENEEGANLLALQTRQQLGVTSLSLAAQSQQSVLRLF